MDNNHKNETIAMKVKEYNESRTYNRDETNFESCPKYKSNVLILKINGRLLILFILLSALVGFSVGSMFTTIRFLNESINDKTVELHTKEVQKMNEDKEALTKIIEDKEQTIIDKDAKIKEQTKSLDSKNQEISKLKEQLFIFNEREELLDKYEIAVMNTNNKRTDLAYDDIKYTEELCLSKKIPPELIFYMMKLESNFNPNLKSNQSSARGLLQVIKGTGEYTHTKLMGKSKDTYNHDKMFDPKTNIEYAVTYIDYLFEQSNGDVYEMMKRYSGGYSEFGIGDRYHQLVEGHMNKFGYSLSQAQKDYNKLNS